MRSFAISILVLATVFLLMTACSRPTSSQFGSSAVSSRLSATVSGNTVTAASCSSSDVQDALKAVTASTTIVNIPGGTCHWGPGSAFYWSVPAGSTTLTVQGQTVCTGSGSPSSNNLACTDNTVIIDDDTATTGLDGNVLVSLYLNSSPTAFFRFTGFTFKAGANKVTNDGIIVIQSTSGGQNLRFDHNHMNMDTWTTTSAPFEVPLMVNGCTFGVADHNIFDFKSGVRTNAIQTYNGFGCGGNTYSNESFAQSVGWGTGQFFFVEDNVFNAPLGGSPATNHANDCLDGGKAVWRYNTLNHAIVQTHPTGSAGPQHRGCYAQEIYGNSFVIPDIPADIVFNVLYMSSGTAMVWDNSAPTGYSNFINLEPPGRTLPGEGYTQTAVPNGWGYCGTASDGVGSIWDGSSTSASGYPCLDQPGRGQSDLLSGGAFPNIIDTVYGAAHWPNQKLTPIYEWLNNYKAPCCGNGTTTGTVTSEVSSLYVANRDYYQYMSSGFTGASGVGSGPLSARPFTCTAGPGGTYGASAVGSAGVAYWATDRNNGQGELYVCTSTNTWTPYYSPYTYPHPLVSGSDPAPTPTPSGSPTPNPTPVPTPNATPSPTPVGVPNPPTNLRVVSAD